MKQRLNQIINSPAQMTVCLILLAALVRIANIMFLADSPLFAVPTSDEAELYSLASRVAAGDWLGRNEGLMMRTPFFSWVCAGLFKVFGTSFLVTHVLILLSDLVSVALWYRVGFKCFSVKAAAIGGLLLCLYRPFIHFSSTGYMESFALAMNGAMVLALCCYFDEVSARQIGRFSLRAVVMLVIAGIMAGLGILTRPTLLIVMPFIGILVCIPFWRMPERKIIRGILAGALLTIVTVVAMSPNGLRHWILFHKWVPLGINGEINFNMSNNDKDLGWWVTSPGIEYSIYKDTPVVIGHKPITVEAARKYWADQNRDYLKNHSSDFLKNSIFKFLEVWNRYEIHFTNDFREHVRLSPVERYAIPSGIAIPLGFTGFVLCLGCLAGFGFCRSKDISGVVNGLYGPVLLCGWILFYLAGVALYHANTRHRLPALPPLMLLGGYAVAEGMAFWRLRQTSLRPVLAVVAIFLIGVLLAWAPVIPAWMPRHEDWWTHINKGVALANLGRPDEAKIQFRKANQVMPRKLEGWLQLAKIDEGLGKPEAAIVSQQHLLSLLNEKYPAYTATYAEQLEQLVKLQLENGQTGNAQKSVVQLMSMAPQHFRSYLMAAQVAHQAGDTTRTQVFLKKAGELAPENITPEQLKNEVFREPNP